MTEGEQPAQAPLLARRQDHDHLAAFELGLGLDLGERRGLVLDPVEKPHAKLLVGHLTAAEAQGHLDLVALVEEAANGLHLHLIVMGVDVRPHLDFFDFDDLLLLARFGGLFLALILEAAEIEDLADGRFGIRRYLDQVETGFRRDLKGPLDGNDAVIVALVINKLDFRNTDVLVDPRPVLGGRRRSKGSANGGYLL
jgi:hypothetical protein